MEKMPTIRLMVGTFDGESFKRIKRAKIGGVSYRDKLTAVWFELLDLAGKSNADGYLIDNNGKPYVSYESIAAMIDREEEELKLCMGFYITEKMVELMQDKYVIANFAKYQQRNDIDKIREQNRRRQALYRQKQAMALAIGESNVTSRYESCANLDCAKSNVTDNVTSRYISENGNENNENNVTCNVTDNVTKRYCNGIDNVTCISQKKKKKVTKKEKEYGGKNNINTTHTRACARNGVTVEQFEQSVGCENWEAFPNGETYKEIRDTMLELINDKKTTKQELLSLNEIDIDLISEIEKSMCIGQERRHITDLRAYICSIITRKRKERQQRGE